MGLLQDVATAVITQWNAQFLNVFCPGGLHLDELQLPDNTLPLMPYAVMHVREETPDRNTFKSYRSHTRVTWEIFDTKPMGSVETAIYKSYDWPTNTLDFSFATPQTAQVYTKHGDRNETVTTQRRNGLKIRRLELSLVFHLRKLFS